jgi:hypothetical protein
MKGLLILLNAMMLIVGGAKADDLWLMALKAPPRQALPTIGAGSIQAAIWVLHGETRIGQRRRLGR